MDVRDIVTRISGSYHPNLGLVTQAIGGASTVHTPSGDVLRCHVRGRLRKSGVRILPGDVVRFARVGDGEGVVEEVLPRRSTLVRPYIANVDQVVLVASLAEPPPSLDLLDRLLVLTQAEGLQAFIVWNKADLVSRAEAEEYIRVYERAGFPTAVTSPKADLGRDELLRGLSGHLTVLAGASGVGKSSLLNWLLQEKRFETGEVSRRLGRGRHTTRAVELVPMPGGGWIADSPGFSVLDLSELSLERLPELYPEMGRMRGACRFTGCLHRNEPGCAVRDAVCAGEIDPGRYERYLRLLGELEEAERRRYQ